MKNFHHLANLLARLFTSVLLLLAVVIVGVYLYGSHPSWFIKNEISAAEWAPKEPESLFESGNMPADVAYGFQLISETSSFIGPMAADDQMHYAGNNLACANCHLQNGTQAGSGSWIGVTDRFPQFRSRSNSQGTIEDRINGCMARSMNGEPLPIDSKEMKAIVSYMEWLGEDLPEERVKEFKGFPKIQLPEVAVDFEKGKALYAQECAVCHGENGQGQKFKDVTKGYQYPPLWGPDSFNDGAGMHRVITAAEFIKSNMPFGQATWENPKLTDEEAYHLAGYINSFSRPHKANLEKDFPDRKLKPVSTPYGPWADNFPAEQHQFGPFQPIMEFYKKQYDLNKTK